jgi:hypothetical protein
MVYLTRKFPYSPSPQLLYCPFDPEPDILVHSRRVRNDHRHVSVSPSWSCVRLSRADSQNPNMGAQDLLLGTRKAVRRMMHDFSSSPLMLHPRGLVDRDRLVYPREREHIAASQILLGHTPAVRPRTNLVPQHLVQIARLDRQPVLYESLWIGPAQSADVCV